MLIEFFLGLLASAGLSFLLYLWLQRRLEINRARRNRYSWVYLLPVLLSVLLVYVLLFQFMPRFLDGLELALGHKNSQTLLGDTWQMEGQEVRTEHQSFILPSGSEFLKMGRTYRIEYAPRSRLILLVEEIENKSGETTGP